MVLTVSIRLCQSLGTGSNPVGRSNFNAYVVEWYTRWFEKPMPQGLGVRLSPHAPTRKENEMYGWHPMVYKVWAYFILVNLYPLIVMERVIERVFGSLHNSDVAKRGLFVL